MKSPSHIKVDEIDAKGARRVKGMPYVLGISLLAVIMLFIVSFAIFVA